MGETGRWRTRRQVEKLVRLREIRDALAARLKDASLAAANGLHRRTLHKMAERRRAYVEQVRAEVAAALDANDLRAVALMQEVLEACSDGKAKKPGTRARAPAKQVERNPGAEDKG